MAATRWLIETTSGAYYLIDTVVESQGTTYLLRWPGQPDQDITTLTPHAGERVVLDAEPAVGEPLAFQAAEPLNEQPSRSTPIVKITRLAAPMPPRFEEVLVEGESVSEAPEEKVLPTWADVLSHVNDSPATGSTRTRHPSRAETLNAEAQEILAKAATAPTVHRTRRRLG